MKTNLVITTSEDGKTSIVDQSADRVLIKAINESESIGMDRKVGISLDGKLSFESMFKYTADSIQGRVIKGSEINETN